MSTRGQKWRSGVQRRIGEWKRSLGDLTARLFSLSDQLIEEDQRPNRRVNRMSFSDLIGSMTLIFAQDSIVFGQTPYPKEVEITKTMVRTSLRPDQRNFHRQNRYLEELFAQPTINLLTELLDAVDQFGLTIAGGEERLTAGQLSNLKWVVERRPEAEQKIQADPEKPIPAGPTPIQNSSVFIVIVHALNLLRWARKADLELLEQQTAVVDEQSTDDDTDAESVAESTTESDYVAFLRETIELAGVVDGLMLKLLRQLTTTFNKVFAEGNAQPRSWGRVPIESHGQKYRYLVVRWLKSFDADSNGHHEYRDINIILAQLFDDSVQLSSQFKPSGSRYQPRKSRVFDRSDRVSDRWPRDAQKVEKPKETIAKKKVLPIDAWFGERWEPSWVESSDVRKIGAKYEGHHPAEDEVVSIKAWVATAEKYKESWVSTANLLELASCLSAES